MNLTLFFLITSPELEPNEHDLWIVVNKLEELFEALTLINRVNKALDVLVLRCNLLCGVG